MAEWDNSVLFLGQKSLDPESFVKRHSKEWSHPSLFIFFLLLWLHLFCNFFFFLTWSSVLQNSIFSFFNTTYLLCLFSYSISWSYLLALLLMTESLNQDRSALLSFWPIYTIANWTHPFKCSWSTLATKYTKVKSSPHPQVSPPYSCHPETG